MIAGPGDYLFIEPGHRAWVVGDEPCVLIVWYGPAAPRAQSVSTQMSGTASVGGYLAALPAAQQVALGCVRDAEPRLVPDPVEALIRARVADMAAGRR